jgi:hypothetical protein
MSIHFTRVVFLVVTAAHTQKMRYYFLNCVYPNPPCQLSLWEETGAPGENPRLSAERWLTLFTWVRSENRTHPNNLPCWGKSYMIPWSHQGHLLSSKSPGLWRLYHEEPMRRQFWYSPLCRILQHYPTLDPACSPRMTWLSPKTTNDKIFSFVWLYRLQEEAREYYTNFNYIYTG